MNILVTALGTLSARTIVQQLRSREDKVVLFGADIFPEEYIVTAKEVDSFHQFPSVVEDEHYLEYILDFCKQNHIEYVFAVIDEEVALLSQNKGLFKEHGITVCTGDIESVECCRDKHITFKRIKETVKEVYTPTVLLSEYTGQFDFPVFVKPREGRASIGCEKIESLDRLEQFKNQVNPTDYIIQTYCKGDIYSIDLVRDHKGSSTGVIRAELQKNKNGAATTVKIIQDEKLLNVGKRIAEAMGILGICNIELFKDGEKIHLIEVNPRFPAGTEFSCMAGVDLVNQHFAAIRGEDIDTQQHINYNITISRRYEAYVTRE